jgi:hypothetical protein
VLRYLAHAQPPHPAITDLILVEAASDPAFRASKEYLLWSHRGGRRDLELYLACLDSADRRNQNDEDPDEIYPLLVDLTAWDIPADSLHDTLRARPGFDIDPVLRAVFCELFPTDEVSQQMFIDLERWFQVADPKPHREWFDSLVTAVRACPALELPIILVRAHHQIFIRNSSRLLPLLMAPLGRRLRQDPAAVAAVRDVMLDPATADTSTPIWAPLQSGEQSRDPVTYARCTFLLATVLQHNGLLDEAAAATVRDVLTATPNVVVNDPFTGAERSLHAVTGTLTRPLTLHL